MDTSLEMLIVVDSRFSVDNAWWRQKRKTVTITEEPSDGLHEKQKHGRRYGGGKTSLAFGSGWKIHLIKKLIIT